LTPEPAFGPDGDLLSTAAAFLAANAEYARICDVDPDDDRLGDIARREDELAEAVAALPATTLEEMKAKANVARIYSAADPALSPTSWSHADPEDQLLWSLASDVENLPLETAPNGDADPIFVLIESCRAAHHAVDHVEGGTAGEAEQRFATYQRAYRELVRAQPTTAVGALALVAYLYEHDHVHRRAEKRPEPAEIDTAAALAVAARVASRFIPGKQTSVPTPCPVEAMGRRYQALRAAEAHAGHAANEYSKASDPQGNYWADADYQLLIDTADKIAEASSLERGHSLVGGMFHLIHIFGETNILADDAVAFAEQVEGIGVNQSPPDTAHFKRHVERLQARNQRRLYAILHILEERSGVSRDEVGQGLMPPHLDPFERITACLSGKYPPAPVGWLPEHPSVRAGS
jgi:hypothetical protein